MNSLTPFLRHALQDAPGTSGPPEEAGSRMSPPLGKVPETPPSQPDSPDVQLPPPEISKPSPMTDGTPAACRQKNAAEYLAGRSPGVMAQYGDGLFGALQHCGSPSPAPTDDPDGVLQLVEWREEAPYG